jgi:2-oxoisovalerate dehydrogenase E2 component (dihydrolipoyl transacylase)
MATGTATTITMPQLGESVTEGTVGNWLKRVGEPVGKYEALVEVVTDKVNAEVPSPVAGVLAEILVEPETTVPVGAVLCRIEEAGVAVASAAAAPAPAATVGGNGDRDVAAGGGAPSVSPISAVRGRAEIAAMDETELLRVRSSPAVRRIAQEHGVEIARIGGSGIGGRVTKRDLVAHLAAAPGTDGERGGAEVGAPAPPPLAATAAGAVSPPPVAATPEAARPVPATEVVPVPPPAPEPGAAPAAGRTPVPVFPGDEVVPVTPMRRTIAEHTVRSERTAPQATVVMEVDMTRVVAFRAAQKEAFRRREGIGLTFLPFAIKAATLALRDHPRLNAVWDEDRILHRAAINVGVAVALEDGLIVPVIRHADRLSVAGLMHAVADLAARARGGGLTPDDVAGGTFTVNNPGSFGSLVSTPILVQPQAAILSTEAIVKRPVVVDDMIAVRSMMNLSLTIDHRILDGLAAARFLQAVKGWLEAEDTPSLY